ncbi:DUF502 domain-containing protein [Microaerobacter geothermalis]|uniref:DUF502 domain-containing protein n=1 Tax=Microaerobacter geothermalis TaxID=674972 RepID=UPI001F3517BE|nr:DUF502 domain-containing protein [Microaerobacter geothermalis]MCF6093393.1 DUF502 domain-containing protein [Microaerobacter geothermalis]
MNRLAKWFLVGIATLAPVGLTVYIISLLFTTLDNLLGKYMRDLPFYFPGLGLILTLAGITLVGFLASGWLGKRLFQLIDQLFHRLPLIRTLYGVIKDTVNSFFGEKRSFSKVVLVRIPGTNSKLLGFLTAEEVSKLGDFASNHVAVYILQSMQWAGFTLLIPKEDVEIVDANVEEVMKFIVSAGISGK